MDYRAFTKNLAHAGLSIREFAELVHMNKNSITNYAKKGQVPTHLGIISQLIAVLADQRVDFRQVLACVPMRLKHGRGVPFASGGDGLPSVQDRPSSTSPEKPRFWYPGDLVIPDAPVPVQWPVVEMPITKAVKVTRRGRKIPGR